MVTACQTCFDTMFGEISIVKVVILYGDERGEESVWHKPNRVQKTSFYGRIVKSGAYIGCAYGSAQVEQMELRNVATHFLLLVVQVNQMLRKYIRGSEMLVSVIVRQIEIGQRGTRIGISEIDFGIVAELEVHAQLRTVEFLGV